MIKFGKETKPRLVEHLLSNPDRDPIEIYSVNISTLLISIFLCRIEYPRKKQQLLQQLSLSTTQPILILISIFILQNILTFPKLYSTFYTIYNASDPHITCSPFPSSSPSSLETFLKLRTHFLPTGRLLPRDSSLHGSSANCGQMTFNYILRIRTSTAWPQFNYFIRAKRPRRQLLWLLSELTTRHSLSFPLSPLSHLEETNRSQGEDGKNALNMKRIEKLARFYKAWQAT